jgi:hypothetical protein
MEASVTFRCSQDAGVTMTCVPCGDQVIVLSADHDTWVTAALGFTDRHRLCALVRGSRTQTQV